MSRRVCVDGSKGCVVLSAGLEEVAGGFGFALEILCFGARSKRVGSELRCGESNNTHNEWAGSCKGRGYSRGEVDLER